MSYQEDSRMSEWYKDVIRARALFRTQWSDAFINVYAAILGSIGPHGVQEDMGSDHRYIRPTLILIHDIGTIAGLIELHVSEARMTW